MKDLNLHADNNTMLNKFYKNLTLVLFFILPSKIANIFINLSIVATIYHIRNLNFTSEQLDYTKIQKVLKVTINEEILLLPNYTIHWFWDENFLSTKVTIDQKDYALKEIIQDTPLFFSHMRLVIGLFLDHLPASLKFKLGVSKTHKRLEVKHNIMNLLIYA